MAMSNAGFKGRATPTGPADDPADTDKPGSRPDAEDRAEVTDHKTYASHEQAVAAAHAHHKKNARIVGMR